MPRRRSPSGHYYYASGQVVDLTFDDNWLALDTGKLKASGLSARLQTSLLKGSRPLRGDLVLIKRDPFSTEQIDELIAGGAAHPVFRAGDALLVALPEVRVEESSAHGKRALRRWILQHGDRAEVVEDDGEKLLLRPTSGQGLDAITLANHLTEQVGPEMAQARFLRVVDHFDTAL